VTVDVTGEAAAPSQASNEALQERELRRLETRLKERSQEATGILATASGLLARAQHEIADKERRSRENLAARAEQATRAARQRADAELAGARAALVRAAEEWGDVAATGDWTDPRWATATPPEVPTGAIRIGSLGEDVLAMVPSIGDGHIQVVARGAAARDRALGVVDTILLRTLASAKPGRVRFRIHDPIGLGASLSSYSQFDRNRIAHGNPTATADDLEQTLESLADQATELSATHLRGVYRTLRDYLADDPRAEVGFEILVLLDVPKGLEATAVERIAVLAAQAPARGIMLVTLQTGEAADLDLGPSAVRVEVARHDDARLPAVTAQTVHLDEPPPTALLQRVAARPIQARAALTFADLHAVSPRSESSAEFVETPIGRSGRDPVVIKFGDDPVNGLLAGSTGSGKSILLRTLVYGLARRYEPSELQLYLLDFKEGVEFQEFAPSAVDRTFLPHAAVVSVNSSREFGLEVLRHLNKTIADRYAMFSAAGSPPKLAGLREKRPDLTLPRIVLVIDEFQRLFEHGDALADAAADELVNIAKQGRAAGVHLLLGTQSIGDVGAGTSVGLRLDGVFKNAGLRIGMRLDERESRELFSSSTNTAAASIHEPGVAIVNNAGGAEEFNTRTIVGMMDSATALEERREAVTRTTTGRIPPRVFDGARGADPAANRALRAALRGRASADLWQTWPAQSLRVGVEDPRTAESIATSLGREARRNLAVIGAGLANAVAIVQWSIVGLAASRPDVAFALVDLLRQEDTAEYGVPAGVVAATASVLERLAGRVRVVRDDTVDSLIQLLEGADETPSVVAVLGGAERLRGRGEKADPDSFETAEEVLRQRIMDGPNDHIHALMSFSAPQDFEALDRGQLFGLRAYLQLPPTALMALTGEDLAPPTGHLALWHDLLNARAPEPAHCYAPFGLDTVPEWLKR
jgi:DNA segregation ATPase FtsK/SpoIIIE, S-DNA-T family